MNLYKRAAEIFRKNGVPIVNITEDDKVTMIENEGTEYRPVYKYEDGEIVQNFTPEE